MLFRISLRCSLGEISWFARVVREREAGKSISFRKMFVEWKCLTIFEIFFFRAANNLSKKTTLIGCWSRRIHHSCLDWIHLIYMLNLSTIVKPNYFAIASIHFHFKLWFNQRSTDFHHLRKPKNLLKLAPNSSNLTVVFTFSRRRLLHFLYYVLKALEIIKFYFSNLI